MEYILDFIYSILKFWPRFKIVQVDEWGLRMTFGKLIRQYTGPAVAWYWPVVTTILTTKRSVCCLDITEQTVTTKNKNTYVINGSVLYQVISPAITLLKNDSAKDNLQEGAANALRFVVSSSDDLICEDVIDEVMTELHEAKTKYGIEVEAVNIAEFAEVIAIRIIGGG